jgi:prevent-host-death family protein
MWCVVERGDNASPQRVDCATMCYMARRQRTSGTVGVRELRQNLSIYLDRVKKGEALTVTEHGAAVALLRPLPTESNVLARLVAEGRATAPTRSIRELLRPRRVTLERPLSELLEALRGERL